MTRSYELSQAHNAIAEFKLGWAGKMAQPTDLQGRPGRQIPQWTSVNNSVEQLNDALLVELAFEELGYEL